MQPPALPDEPLVAAALGLTLALFVGNSVALVYWARREAAARDSSTVRVLAYAATGVGLLHYFYVRYLRDDLADRGYTPTRGERLATVWTVAAFLAFLVVAVAAPPDPVTQVLWYPLAFTGAFLVAFLTASHRSTRAEAATAE